MPLTRLGPHGVPCLDHLGSKTYAAFDHIGVLTKHMVVLWNRRTTAHAKQGRATSVRVTMQVRALDSRGLSAPASLTNRPYSCHDPGYNSPKPALSLTSDVGHITAALDESASPRPIQLALQAHVPYIRLDFRAFFVLWHLRSLR